MDPPIITPPDSGLLSESDQADAAALPQAPSAVSRRRRFQVSLRTLLMVMLCAGLLFGWIAHKRKQSRERLEVVAAIEKLGGKIGNNVELPVRPLWLQAILGDDAPDYICSVIFDGCELRKADLTQLRRLPQLNDLWLGNSDIDDTSLAQLEHVPEIEMLSLVKARISDAGLTHLKRHNLKHLGLHQTPITDAGLVHLQHWKHLENLVLGDTLITNEGLERVGDCRNLKGLDLSGTAITDEGLVQLRELSHLQTLTLGRTDISGTGLAHLQELSNLQLVFLNGAKLTSDGIAHIAGLKHLKSVRLGHTNLTDGDLVHLTQLNDLEWLDLAGTPIAARDSLR